jgi:hypothetical protein
MSSGRGIGNGPGRKLKRENFPSVRSPKRAFRIPLVESQITFGGSGHLSSFSRSKTCRISSNLALTYVAPLEAAAVIGREELTIARRVRTIVGKDSHAVVFRRAWRLPSRSAASCQRAAKAGLEGRREYVGPSSRATRTERPVRTRRRLAHRPWQDFWSPWPMEVPRLITESPTPSEPIWAPSDGRTRPLPGPASAPELRTECPD